MKRSDRTTIGGTEGRFKTTRWSEIDSIAKPNADQRRAALNGLIQQYWKPVYCYLRRKGCDNEQAKDLTQGFFHEIVLGRRLIEQADADKGRFRTFLLTALDRYVTSVHRHEAAAKRRPKEAIAALEEVDEGSMSVVAGDMKPEDAFTYVWASELLQEVLAEVKQGCAQDGKGAHWQLFCAHVLDPIVAGQESPGLAQLCSRLGVPGTTQAANMIVTVKRRFQAALHNRMRDYVRSDEEVNQEIRDLMEIFSR